MCTRCCMLVLLYTKCIISLYDPSSTGCSMVSVAKIICVLLVPQENTLVSTCGCTVGVNLILALAIRYTQCRVLRSLQHPPVRLSQIDMPGRAGISQYRTYNAIPSRALVNTRMRLKTEPSSHLMYTWLWHQYLACVGVTFKPDR